MAAIYLDYNATTPLDPRVFEVMKEWFLGPPANSGSRTHVYGQRAKDAVEEARSEVAAVINAKPEEIIFTSGATESNNLAILGLAAHGELTGRKHIISTAIEHKAVLEPLECLAKKGFEIELAPVNRGGHVDPDDVIGRCRSDTLLVSVMHANNETGVIQPIGEIAKALRERDTLFHVDAAQTFGKETELASIDFDLLSISAHKIHGPQGIGALCTKRLGAKRIPLTPLNVGGGQERGLRPGTLPVALAVGFGKSSQLARTECNQRMQKVRNTRSDLQRQFALVDHDVNGDPARIQSHVVNIRFPGVDSEALMMSVKAFVAVSNGSACTSDAYSPSHVLRAMGLTEDAVNESIRISWGTDAGQIDLGALVDAVGRLSGEF